MAYEVTARRWRPQEFERVIGQDHVTTTLKNAIQSGQIAHAYLFTGPRGVGKTTTARILAKALNCVNGPTTTPCNTCNFCQEIAEGRSVDVLEIDGASNNKVEQIRTQLLESVKYTPSQGKHKIYIIDEVHMLTKEAFNALLKTLEEPPEHVYFIFATTDPQKVLPTIVSRCQRFDFRRISGQVMVDHLAMISEKSDYNVERDALAIVARRADGSLRDAESLFDQVIAFGGASLSARDVANVLGLITQDIYFDLFDIISSQDVPGGLHLIDSIVQQGYNLDEVAIGILEHLRNLLIVKEVPDTPEILDTAAIDFERYHAQTTRFQEEDLLRLVQLATDMEETVKHSARPRIQLEVGIVRMIRMESTVLLTDVLEQLNDLSERMEKGGEISVPPSTMKSQTPNVDTLTSAPPPQAPNATASISESLPLQEVREPVKETQVPLEASPSFDTTEQIETVIPSQIQEERSVPEKSEDTLPLETPNEPLADVVPEPSAPIEAVPSQEPDEDVAEPDILQTANTGSDTASLDDIKKHWPDILAVITKQRISLGNLLAAGMIIAYENREITLAFTSKHEFHKQQAEKKDNTKLIESEFISRLGFPVRIICTTTDEPPPEASQPLLPSKPIEEVKPEGQAGDEPAVKRILDAFDGQIISK